jgi:hypothetical protein
MYSSTHSLTSALDRGEWLASRTGRSTPRERTPGTNWIRGWVGPRAVLDAVLKRKILSYRRESNPRTPIVQLVAQYIVLVSTINNEKFRVEMIKQGYFSTAHTSSSVNLLSLM